MTTTTITKPAFAVVWPPDTFWPPNTKAANVALGAFEYLERSPNGSSTPFGRQAAANIKAFLLLACECAPEPYTMLPADE